MYIQRMLKAKNIQNDLTYDSDLPMRSKSPNICGLYGRPLMNHQQRSPQRKVHGDAVPIIELSKEKTTS